MQPLRAETRSRVGRVGLLPFDSPGQHQCKTCSGRAGVLDVWSTCACPDCQTARTRDVGTLISTISTNNENYYWKHKKSGIYEFSKDPNEVPLALAVLTACLQREARNIDSHDLAKVASLASITIHVQGICNEGCKPQNIDCSAAIQLARQELARRSYE